MIRYHVFMDGKGLGSTATKSAAIDMIRAYQEKETHQWLKAEFSLIKGEEEFIPYEKQNKKGRMKNES